MSKINKIVAKGRVLGILSHQEIRQSLDNEIDNPDVFFRLIEKLEELNILCYREPGSQRLHRLMKKGKSLGSLTRTEVIKSLPKEISNEECINDILEMVTDMGIKLRVL